MSKLRTKDITLENHTRVYEHIAEVDIWPKTTKLARFVVSQLYRPSVHMQDDTRQFITEQIRNNRPLLFTPNHVQYIDHLVGFSALDSQFDFGDTNILGKVAYFQSPVARALSEPFGTLPVWRKKDLPSDPSATEMRQFAEAGIELIDVVVDKMAQGNNVFGFPEGTRNDKDRFDENNEDKWLSVMKLQQGIAKIAFNAWTKQDIPISIVPMGIYYDYDVHGSSKWRHPVVYISEPIVKDENDAHANSIAAITKRMQARIQESVLEAKYTSIKKRRHRV